MMLGEIQDWLEQALTVPANSDPAIIRQTNGLES
jgi:hypothetical protein